MRLRGSLGAAAATLIFVSAACGGGGDDDPAPVTVNAPVAEETTTSSTTTSSTTTTTAPTTTTTIDPADDGIASPEDASVFVLTSWIAGDRDAVARHAEPDVVDQLFSIEPPGADSLELVECDSSDLEHYDCFFVAGEQIIIVGVEDLRVIDVTIDDGKAHADGGQDEDDDDD